jgi:hypothetical protein
MSSGAAEKTAGGNLKKPGLSIVATWVKSAWDELPIDMITRSFLKCGISNAMDGTEDDLLWQDPSTQPEEGDPEFDDEASGWDSDERITQTQWEELFGVSDDESDFEGFE